MSVTPSSQNSALHEQEKTSGRFLSWRWRFVVPLFLVIIVVTTIGTYLVVSSLAQNFTVAEENVLLLKTESVADSTITNFERLRSEARRTAFTVGVIEAINTNDVASLQTILRGIASASDLDSLIVTDASGIEVAGVLRVLSSDSSSYSVSTGTDLSDEPVLNTSTIASAGIVQTAFLRTTQGIHVYIALPILEDDVLLGYVLVGQSVSTLIAELRTSALADITIYGDDGFLLATTFNLEQVPAETLAISSTIQQQTLSTRQRVLSSLTLTGIDYRAITMPFDFGGQTLGIIQIMQPDDVAFTTFTGRQSTAIFVSVFAGIIVAFVVGMTTLMLNRLRRVSGTVDALAQGNRASRTAMQPVDEVSQLGYVIDQYASTVQKTEDRLRSMLRRQRRERNYLLSVLESMPDGVIVQDEQANLVVMNDIARELFGVKNEHDVPSLKQFEALIKNKLGDVIAPGIYALGDPMALENDGKMLNAQAVAVLAPTGKRLGTVVILRDMTQFIRQSQAHESLLDQLSADIQEPLAKFTREQSINQDKLVNNFAREIARHAASLQKMIVDMRELTRYSQMTARERQRVIAVDTLIWAVANDWRQIALAAGLSLEVDILKPNLFALGDESRLRYALGNIVDNAIKYTPQGGQISLEVKDVVGDTIHLRVRDNGVGISSEDYPYIFTPFYRGNPMTDTHQVIHVPGMGLGLSEAQTIIQAHGGIIRVKTRPLTGTAVYLALPLTSGVSYGLPMLTDADLDGDTVLISDPAASDDFQQDL